MGVEQCKEVETCKSLPRCDNKVLQSREDDTLKLDLVSDFATCYQSCLDSIHHGYDDGAESEPIAIIGMGLHHKIKTYR